MAEGEHAEERTGGAAEKGNYKKNAFGNAESMVPGALFICPVEAERGQIDYEKKNIKSSFHLQFEAEPTGFGGKLRRQVQSEIRAGINIFCGCLMFILAESPADFQKERIKDKAKYQGKVCYNKLIMSAYK